MIDRTFRWLPVWPGVLLLPVWLFFFRMATLSSPIPVPVFLLLGCGVLMFFNRTRVTVSVDGIFVKCGPMPLTMPSFHVPLSHVKSTYSREVFRPGKSGGNYFAAGVQTADGEFLDVLAPLSSAAEAQEGAMAIGSIVVSATKLGLDCESYGVKSIPQDMQAHRNLVAWLVILLAAVLMSAAIAVLF